MDPKSVEMARLKSLRRHAILDTPPEVTFDCIAGLAARALDVPIATVTMIDENRQWFKACYGMEGGEVPREVSFCNHVVASGEMLVINDATKDPRFKDNPLVTGASHIRFYAGVPLKGSGGENIGTLCALDREPRVMTEAQQATLVDLGALATSALQLRLANLVQNQLTTAIDNLTSGVLVTDASTGGNAILFANPAFTAITGYQLEEIEGTNCKFLQGPDTDPLMVDEIRLALRERRTFKGVILNYRKNGESFWNELTVSPVMGDDGTVTNFVGLQSDVTVQRRADDALRESYARLRELEGMRDGLTSMIVHDLRSPLTGVKAWLDLLNLSTDTLSADDAEAVRFASEGTSQLNAMITSLLDVTRLESGKMPVALNSMDLAALARAAVVSYPKRDAGPRLTYLDPEGAVAVTCDAELTSRVIANLIGNAIKFTPREGSVTVAVERVNNGARFSVTDTGPGIPPEFRTKVFDKFAQVESTRQLHSTGLGLTFCKLAMEAQGGTIGVDSVFGSGSTFWFTLPS